MQKSCPKYQHSRTTPHPPEAQTGVQPLVWQGDSPRGVVAIRRGEAKGPVPSKGTREANSSRKKRLIWGWKGSPERQVHPAAPRSPVSCLPPQRCHLRLRHHIPFQAREERGKFFLFWISRVPGCGWKGVVASQRSPNGDQLPPP